MNDAEDDSISDFELTSALRHIKHCFKKYCNGMIFKEISASLISNLPRFLGTENVLTNTS